MQDGDYNKEIAEMHQTSTKYAFHTGIEKPSKSSVKPLKNGLCERCNFYQQKKLEKMTSFQPRSEVFFFFCYR